MSAPERILVRLPNWVGDVVMATPALRALRAAHPAAEIVAEGRPFLAGLVAGLPSIDEFLADPRQRGLGAAWQRGRRLRERRFDWAVLLPDSSSAAIGPWLARVPLRIGYAREPVRRFLLTRSLAVPRAGGERVPVPMVERYLAVTRAAGCPDAGDEMELAVDPELATGLDARLADLGVAPDEGLLALTPGANFGSSKLWPPEHFAAAADEIARRHALRVVIGPGPGEEPIARAIADRAEVTPVVLEGPVTSLAELKALVARARLVLSNDTGPRAMAVALGTPVVVLMGPTDPRHTAMHLERQRVLREEVDCSPCHLKVCPIDHRCMTRLTPERAVAAAEELLGREATPG